MTKGSTLPCEIREKNVARRFCLKNVHANLASLFNDQTSIAFYHLKPFLLLVFAFVLLIFWFIQFSLILLCFCDARSMASILVTMKVLSTIYTRQNITIMALVLIMFFHLSFPDGLSTRIANKRHHGCSSRRTLPSVPSARGVHCSCAKILSAVKLRA